VEAPGYFSTGHMEIALPLDGHRLSRDDPHRVALVCAWAATVVASAIAAAVAASSDTGHPLALALARAAMVGVPAAVGLYAIARGPGERFGAVLVVVGAAWFLTTFAESSEELPYSLGRIAGWFIEVLIVYALLSFPTGRLESHADRLLVRAMGVVLVVFYLPRILFAEHFDVPSPYTSCVADCPRNAFFAVNHEPAFMHAVLRPAGTTALALIMAVVAVRLWRRMSMATPLSRRIFQAVLVIAAARATLMVIGAGMRWIDPDEPIVEAIAWALALAVPALAIGFLIGLLRWDFFAGRALARLASSVQAMPDGPTLRRAFAEAFRDDSIQIGFPASHGEAGLWNDCWGDPIASPRNGDGRAVSDVTDRGVVVAALFHDQALCAHPELIRAGTAMAAVALDNQRLSAEADAAADEVRQSRARLATEAERERRRIERDLHDGAQQHLVALRIELELAEDLVRQDAERGAVRLHELEGQVDEALGELRSLAHGVYPALLADRGLDEALRAAVARCTVAAKLHVIAPVRCDPEIEGAVYFCVLEALQNVAKHAAGARRALVTLDGTRHGELRFTVRDDGAGTDRLVAGAGVTNMRDRVAAFGGDIRIASTPRVGTQVSGRVPTSARAAR
jgi:signal transduction histidine kinase